MSRDNHIRELRKNHNLSQETFSAIFRITQQAVSRMENNSYDIPTHLLIQMAEFFNVTTDYILGLTDMKRNPKGQARMDEEMDRYYDIVLRYQKLTDTNRKTFLILLERLEEAQREEDEHFSL